MSIRIKFSQSELRDRAATILGVKRWDILNVAPTCGGKKYFALLAKDRGQECVTFTVWQLVDALPLKSCNVSSALLLTPVELLEAMSFMGLSLIPDIEMLKKTYRKISKKCHPDVGGNADDFRKLFDCYQKIEAWIRANSPHESAQD